MTDLNCEDYSNEGVANGVDIMIAVDVDSFTTIEYSDVTHKQNQIKRIAILHFSMKIHAKIQNFKKVGSFHAIKRGRKK